MFRVRLGDMFESECDVLVIPCSTAGVARPILNRLQGIVPPLPPLGLGGIHFARAESQSRWIAVAVSVHQKRSSASAIRQIGDTLGGFAQHQPEARTFVAPLLGTGTGQLTAEDSAYALFDGFGASAPADARLELRVKNQQEFWAAERALQFLLFSRERAGDRAVGTGYGAAGGRESAVGASDAALVAPGSRSTEAADMSKGVIDIMSLLKKSVEATSKQQAEAGPHDAVRSTPRSTVFISYSHKDRKWLERLRVHLKSLEREGLITLWDDTLIKPGTPWKAEIERALDAARVAILLISADFLASDYVRNDELPPLLDAARAEGATILPLILSPCRFVREESLARFQAVNDPARPLNALPRAKQEEVLDRLSEVIEKAMRL